MKTESVLMPLPVKASEYFTNNFVDYDCGDLGLQELVVSYRYTDEDVDIVPCGDEDVEKIIPINIEVSWANIRTNPESKGREGIPVLGMFEDLDNLHNLIIEWHPDATPVIPGRISF